MAHYFNTNSAATIRSNITSNRICPGPTWTMGAWVTIDSQPTWPTTLYIGGYNTTDDLNGTTTNNKFYLDTDGSLRVQHPYSGAGEFYVSSSPISFTVDRWHYLSVTRYNAGNWALYVDGQNVAGSVTQTGGGSEHLVGGDRVMIGGRNLGGNNSKFLGQIANFSMWNTALLPAEHLYLARGIHPFFIQRPKLHWLWEGKFFNDMHERSLNGATQRGAAGVNPVEWKEGYPPVTSPPVDTYTNLYIANNLSNLNINSLEYFIESALPFAGSYAKATWVALYGTTDINGEVSSTRVMPSNQPVSGYARKSTSSPFYKPGSTVGTIDSTKGVDLTAVLIKDE